MKHLFTFMCATLFLFGCTDDANKLSPNSDGWGTPTPPATNDAINAYRTRTTVVNPGISLIDVTSSADDKLKADYALEYRFFINNYHEDKTARYITVTDL